MADGGVSVLEQASSKHSPSTDRKKAEYAGPYRLLETVGSGGMATVKVALDPVSGRKVAVKIVDKAKLTNPREQVSMAREITIMKLLRHPNVLRLYDIYESEEKILMILDYYAGGDLYHLITESGALRPSLARKLFQQLISGIQFCHEHMIIHRDLKPENLLLSADHQTLVLSDFGLSTAMQGSRRFLKTRCGTVHYIAPEVAKGEDYIGMASDVWSCGVILYTMVTACLPFDGDTAVDVLKKIARGDFAMPSYLPLELQDLLQRMMWPDPSERISTHEVLKHPWLSTLAPIMVKAEPLSRHSRTPSVAGTITEELIDENPDIVDNLVLLGWDRDELRTVLLSPDRDISKVFFNLLLTRRNQRKEEPKAVTSDEIVGSSAAVPRVRRAMSISDEGGGKNINLAASAPSDKPVNAKLSRQIRRVAPPMTHRGDQPSRMRANTGSESAEATRRRATVGDGAAPLKGFWGMSPSKNPHAKIYRVESGKSINQIFDNLKHVFGGLDGDMKVTKKKSGIKVVASHKDASGKKNKIKVSMQEREPGNSVVTFKSDKKNERFGEILQQVEKTLDSSE